MADGKVVFYFRDSTEVVVCISSDLDATKAEWKSYLNTGTPTSIELKRDRTSPPNHVDVVIRLESVMYVLFNPE